MSDSALDVAISLEGAFTIALDSVIDVQRGFPYQGWTHLVFPAEENVLHLVTELVRRTERHAKSPEFMRWSLEANAISLAPIYTVDVYRNEI